MAREHDEDFIDDREELEVPDVPWADDIRRIENPILQQKEIEVAEKLLEEQIELEKKLNVGEIDQIEYEAGIQHKLGPKMAQAATRSGLASEGITWDHLGDISENYDLLHKGDPKLFDLKDQVKEKIREIGVDNAQKLADEMLEQGKISKEAHELISRQVRLQKDSQE